ncbi:hypothetical protein [Gynuella sunshinyii]|uniref:hypothetical protein n=1 Tax=Gynuella sunshinyii TaxID=1445505 RepID=UPI0005CC57F1|nr:hypothetical protein [Gynuella sunshinyii]
MTQNQTKWFASVVLGLFLFPVAGVFLNLTTPFWAWLIIWWCVFTTFLQVSWRRENRGLFLLVMSAGLAALGVAYCKVKNPEFLWGIELLANIMVLVGAGVGGNFMAAGYLERET